MRRSPIRILDEYVALEFVRIFGITVLGFPIFMSETPGRLSRTAPCVGQHSAEILHELLGYSEARIGELAANGIVSY